MGARVLLIVIGILLFFFTTITVSFSQVWDNKWFKFKGRAHGYVVDDRGSLSKTFFSGRSYVYFHWNSSDYRYELTHWVQNTSGEWVSFNGILPVPIGNNEILWRDIYTRLQNGNDWIWVYAVARVKIHHDDSNFIDRARFTSMGCEAPMGSIDGQNFGGKCRLRGKMVGLSDLPFTP